jgi:DNA-binding MarR family transcriptional regulator
MAVRHKPRPKHAAPAAAGSPTPAGGRAGTPEPKTPHRRSPRTTTQVDAYLAILRAAGELERQVIELLKTADLTASQYNVLRILRGGGADGLSCGELGERLIRHDPDVTRLVDRLEKRGLIERSREARDRRVVRTRITGKGLDVLDKLDAPMDAVHERQLGHMDEARLSALTKLIEAVRTRPA